MSYREVDNSNREWYYKQTNNKRSPFISCFPTSMINASQITKVKLPDLPVNCIYDQPEDQYDEFLHSQKFMSWAMTKPSIVNLLEDDYDIREIWEAEVQGFNEWVGKRVCEIDWDFKREELIETIDAGGAIVTSGTFGKFKGHCVTICGYGVDSGLFTKDNISKAILLDPYGDPFTRYAKVGFGGYGVRYPFEDFWKVTEKYAGMHYGIKFLPEWA